MKTVIRQPSWISSAWILLAGVASVLVLWGLATIQTLQPLLFAPLRWLHHLSWALLGRKLIPDGDWSTCFVSAYFFAFGCVIGAGVRWGCRHLHAVRRTS